MHIEHLDGGVNASGIEHEQHADSANEHERQDLHLGMAVDEIRDGVDEHHHNDDGDHHGQDHDDEVLGQAHSGDDRVDGEDEIHHHDGAHGLGQPDQMGGFVRLGRLGLDLGEGEHVDKLANALIYEVGAASEHDDVAHREPVAPHAHIEREQRRGHVHQIRGKAQEQDAHDQGASQAQLAADVLLFRRQAVGGDGNEHQVVHTQNDLQKDQRQQTDPGLRGGENRQIHLFLLVSTVMPATKKDSWCNLAASTVQACTTSLAI